MYAHRHIRRALEGVRGRTKHRHQVHTLLISTSILLLLYTASKHAKLRTEAPGISPLHQQEFDQKQKKVETFQEFDYDAELTEEEKAILKKSFHSADFDNNKFLSETEISMAINRETKQHITKAMRNNFKVFFSLDKLHRNGQIDWDEYYGYYMKARLGMEAADLRRMEADPASVGREVREAVAEVRAAWSEAARSNPEAVNIDEFLGLEHPESSHSLLTQRVEEMMEKYDADGDGKLSQAEYTRDPYRDLDQEEVNLREAEFKLILDQNKDGVADKREVVHFLDPKNPHWARYEAINLVSRADTNGDNLLELAEILAKPDLFLFSKMVSGDAGFHGEF